MGNLNDFWLLFAVFAGWFVLVRWVLPWLGVPTCMCCSCAVEPKPAAGKEASAGDENKENEA